MPNVVRAGDINSAGGAANIGASTVKCEGKPVMLPNMPVTPHPCCGSDGCNAHCNARTTGGSSTVRCEGKPVIHSNDIDSCGHKRQTSAATVKVGA